MNRIRGIAVVACVVAFGLAGVSRAAELPEGYRAVEYVAANGTQYVDVGLPLTNTYSVEVGFMLTGSLKGQYIFGARTGASERNFQAFTGSNGELDVDFNNSSYETTRLDYEAMTANTRYWLRSGRDLRELRADGPEGDVLKSDDTPIADEFSTPKNCLLFSCDCTLKYSKMTGRIYSLRITDLDADKAIRDLVPCVRLSDGAVGFYDVSDHSDDVAYVPFYANKGTGAFRAPGLVGCSLACEWSEAAGQLTDGNGFLPVEADRAGYAAGDTVEFRAPSAALPANMAFDFTVTGWKLYETDVATGAETLADEGEGVSLDYVYRDGVTPRVEWQTSCRRHPTALPIGYRELEYIESTGEQYIDTGYTRAKAAGKVAFYCWTTNDFGYKTATSGYSDAFGDEGSSKSYRYFVRYYSSGFYVYSNATGLKVDGIASGCNTILADMGGKTIDVNGTVSTIAAPGASNVGTFSLFATRRSSSGGGNPACCRLYRCDIWSSATAHARDFVPCVREADGVRGLMDVVNMQFYANAKADAADFIAGPWVPGSVEVDGATELSDILSKMTEDYGFAPARGQTVGHAVGETIAFRAPAAAIQGNGFFDFTVTGWKLYETDDATGVETPADEGQGTSLDYTYKAGVTPRLVWQFAYAARPIHSVTLTGALEVQVPEGVTAQIDFVNGSGGVITKTGGGTLEIQCLSNTTAQVAVEEGAVHFTNPRPDEIFGDAYLHLDASALSTLDIETVNGTNFVNQWFDANGGTHYATNCTTVWNERKDPANRRPFLVEEGQNGRPYVHFGSILTRHVTNEFGVALGYGAAMKLDQAVSMREGFTVFSDTEDYKEWNKLGYSVTGQTPMAYEIGDGWIRGPIDEDGLSYWSKDTSPCNAHFPQSTSPTNLVVDFKNLSSRPKFTSPTAGFHMLRVLPLSPLTVGHLAAERIGTGSVASENRVYGGQKIAEYVLFTRTLAPEERHAISRYLWTKWFAQNVLAVTVRSGAKFIVDDDVNLTIGGFYEEPGAEVSFGGSTARIDSLDNANVGFRLDASDTNTLDIVRENGTNFVERWHDANGKPAYAVTNMVDGYFHQRTDPANRKPFVTEGRSATGLPVVDFGTPMITVDSKKLTEATATGYGASMMLSASQAFRHMLLVAEDNAAITNQVAGKDGVSYVAYNSSKNDGGNQGRRGLTAVGSNAPLYYNVSSSGNSYFVGGTHYIDNAKVSYTAKPPVDELYLLDSRLTASYTANRIARTYRIDSSYAHDCYGGMRYGEMLLFKTALPEEERDRANRILRHKWFGDGYADVHSFAKLAVSAGGSVTVANEAVAVTDTLSLGGRLAVPNGLSAANLTAVAADAEIEGEFTLGEDATLSFAQIGAKAAVSSVRVAALALPATGTIRLTVTNEKALRGKTVKLVDCAAITGSLDGWTTTVDGFDLGVTFTVAEDGLYAEFGRLGALLILR